MGLMLDARERLTRRDPFELRGFFRLPIPEAERIDKRLHRAIVLVVRMGGLDFVDAPFREKAFFADDVKVSNGATEGWFSLDLFELLGTRLPGEYYVSGSLGERLSNTLKVVVT